MKFSHLRSFYSQYVADGRNYLSNQGNDLLRELDSDASSEARNALKKKDKKLLKHELFLQRSLVLSWTPSPALWIEGCADWRPLFFSLPSTGLEASSAPYSKSHARRIKRKEKEQIAGGLGAIKAAISSMEGNDNDSPATAPSGSLADNRNTDTEMNDDQPTGSTSSKKSATAPHRPGQIGEGKKAPLSKAQRKQAL